MILKRWYRFLKHNSEPLFVTPGKGRGRSPPNPVTSEGKQHRWARSGGGERVRHGAPQSRPRALPTPPESRGIWGTGALQANSDHFLGLTITGP